jgi:dolichol-phosphate mannosyltransferase
VFAIIFVDDGSTDGTIELIDELALNHRNITLIKRKEERGIGSAIRTGLKRALEFPDVEKFVQMDGDLSHDPNDLPLLLKGQADMVIGSRYVIGARATAWRFSRRMISSLANSSVHLLLGIRIRDCTSGYRSYDRDVAKLLSEKTKTNGYSFQVESIWLVQTRGKSIAEVPIRFEDRKYGESKLDLIREPIRLMWFLLRHAFGKPH